MTECCIDEAAADIVIVPGNNFPPCQWQFLETEDPDVIFPIDDTDFYLRIRWPGGGLIDRNTVDNAAEFSIDLANSILAWNFDVPTSRELPVGRVAQYELERRAGSAQQMWIKGYVVVGGGLNVD